MTSDANISPGERYKSVLTGHTHRVLDVDQEEDVVRVEQIGKVSLPEMREDIEEGRLVAIDQ